MGGSEDRKHSRVSTEWYSAAAGTLVSAERRGGITVRVEITAEPGSGFLRLHDPFGSLNAKWSKMPTRLDDTYTFDLVPGEVLVGEAAE